MYATLLVTTVVRRHARDFVLDPELSSHPLPAHREKIAARGIWLLLYGRVIALLEKRWLPRMVALWLLASHTLPAHVSEGRKVRSGAKQTGHPYHTATPEEENKLTAKRELGKPSGREGGAKWKSFLKTSS